MEHRPTLRYDEEQGVGVSGLSLLKQTLEDVDSNYASLMQDPIFNRCRKCIEQVGRRQHDSHRKSSSYSGEDSDSGEDESQFDGLYVRDSIAPIPPNSNYDWNTWATNVLDDLLVDPTKRIALMNQIDKFESEGQLLNYVGGAAKNTFIEQFSERQLRKNWKLSQDQIVGNLNELRALLINPVDPAHRFVAGCLSIEVRKQLEVGGGENVRRSVVNELNQIIERNVEVSGDLRRLALRDEFRDWLTSDQSVSSLGADAARRENRRLLEKVFCNWITPRFIHHAQDRQVRPTQEYEVENRQTIKNKIREFRSEILKDHRHLNNFVNKIGNTWQESGDGFAFEFYLYMVAESPSRNDAPGLRSVARRIAGNGQTADRYLNHMRALWKQYGFPRGGDYGL